MISLDPVNTHAFHNRGISYDKKGEYELAIRDFSTVIDIDPSNANAFFNRYGDLSNLFHQISMHAVEVHMIVWVNLTKPSRTTQERWNWIWQIKKHPQNSARYAAIAIVLPT